MATPGETELAKHCLDHALGAKRIPGLCMISEEANCGPKRESYRLEASPGLVCRFGRTSWGTLTIPITEQIKKIRKSDPFISVRFGKGFSVTVAVAAPQHAR